MDSIANTLNTWLTWLTHKKNGPHLLPDSTLCLYLVHRYFRVDRVVKLLLLQLCAQWLLSVVLKFVVVKFVVVKFRVFEIPENRKI